MSLLGSNWKNDPTPVEQLNELTGGDYAGATEDEVIKELEKLIKDPYVSDGHRRECMDLQAQLLRKNEEY